MTSFGNTGGGPVEKIRIEVDGSQAKREADEVSKSLKRVFDASLARAEAFNNAINKIASNTALPQIKKFNRDVQLVGKTSDVTSDKLESMFNKSAVKAAVFNNAISLGIRALGALVQGIKEGISAALEYDKTTRQLQITTRLLQSGGQDLVFQFQQQSAELERLTGISDEVIRKYQVMAMNAGANAEEVDKLLRAAISLSNGFDMELGSAIKNLIKTQSGLTGELGEAIPWIRNLSAEQLKAGDAIDLVNEKLGDQLTVMTQGESGRVVGLNTAWESFTEALGKAIIRSQEFKSSADAATASLSAMAQVFERGGVLAGIGAGIDIALFGGESVQETLEGYKRIDALTQQIAEAKEALRVQMPGGGFDFGGQGGIGGFEIAKPEKRKKGKDLSIDFGGGREEWQDFIIAPNGQIYSQANWDAMQELSVQVEEGLRDRAQSNLDYQVELSNRMIAEEERVAEARKKLSEESWGSSAKAAVTATQQALGAINAFAQGGLVGMLQYAASVAASYGMQSIASGTAHEALAASLAFIPGMQAAAAGLAASAANEIAVGTALAVGGQIAGAGIGLGRQAASGGFSDFNVLTGPGGGGGGGSDNGGGGGTSETFAGGFTGGFATSSTSEGGDRSITIVIEGDVLDAAETGRKVFHAINEAKRVGII